MIKIFSEIRLYPIELANLSRSIILGTLPEGHYATFVEYLKTQSPVYKRMIKKQHGALYYYGPSLEDFEDRHGSLPNFSKEYPYAADNIPGPFYTDLIVFADKDNYNKVLIKTIKTFYQARGEKACWNIYKGYKRQTMFSMYRDFESYYLDRPEFERLFNTIEPWTQYLQSMIPFECLERITDEELHDLITVSLSKDISFHIIDALVHIAHIFPEIYPDEFRWDMSWEEWHQKFQEMFPLHYIHAIGDGNLQSNDSTRFGRLMNQKNNIPLLRKESFNFYVKWLEGNPHYSPSEDWINTRKAVGFYDTPPNQYREKLKRIPSFLAEERSINNWIWKIKNL